MKIKLFLTDLDGTLLSSKDNISQTNIEAINRLKLSGVTTAIATGRTLLSSQYAIQTIKPDFFIGMNGALVYDVNNERILQKKVMNSKIAYNIITELDRASIKYLICGFNGLYCRNKTNLLTNTKQYGFLERYGSAIQELTNIDEIETATVFAVISNQNEYNILKSMVASMPELNMLATLKDGYDIVVKGIDKSQGLKELCNTLGIAINQSAAIGDSENDIQMLKTAHVSFAVDNAGVDVKMAAGIAAPSNDEDGVAFAINYLYSHFI